MTDNEIEALPHRAEFYEYMIATYRDQAAREMALEMEIGARSHMTDDEIQQLAAQAGIEQVVRNRGAGSVVLPTPVLRRFAELCVRRYVEIEREACAKVCDSIDSQSFGVMPVRVIMISDRCAALIRARSNSSGNDHA